MSLFKKQEVEEEIEKENEVSLFEDDSIDDDMLEDNDIAVEQQEQAEQEQAEQEQAEQEQAEQEQAEQEQADNLDFDIEPEQEIGTQSKPQTISGLDYIGENDCVLYVIVDKPIDGMLNYFRGYGLNVSKIFDNIKDARDTMIMQIIKSKIVVIDTGTGRFTNMAARNELVDLLGISDEDNDAIVFYSDSVIKSEVEYSKEVEDRRVTWVKYKSTAQVLAYMLAAKGDDNYIPDSDYVEAAEIMKDLRCIGGKVKSSNNEKVNIGECQISTSDIISKQTGDNGEYQMLQGYTVVI